MLAVVELKLLVKIRSSEVYIVPSKINAIGLIEFQLF